MDPVTETLGLMLLAVACLTSAALTALFRPLWRRPEARAWTAGLWISFLGLLMMVFQRPALEPAAGIPRNLLLIAGPGSMAIGFARANGRRCAAAVGISLLLALPILLHFSYRDPSFAGRAAVTSCGVFVWHGWSAVLLWRRPAPSPARLVAILYGLDALFWGLRVIYMALHLRAPDIYAIRALTFFQIIVFLILQALAFWLLARMLRDPHPTSP